jgi:hypothetical protein
MSVMVALKWGRCMSSGGIVFVVMGMIMMVVGVLNDCGAIER